MQNISKNRRVISFTRQLLYISALFSLLNFLSPLAAQESERPSATIEFNLSNKYGTPDNVKRSKFDCLDQIYAVSQIVSLSEGKHLAEFKWINPQGQAQEITSYKFLVNQSNAHSVKLWAWLKLSRGRGAAFFQWLDPATGLEEFIGEWRVELKIDGKELTQNTFDVNC